MPTLSSAEVPQKASPCVMVLFGAGGDLTKRKLLPALGNLAKEGLLSQQFAIVGFSFDQMTTESFRAKLTADMKEFAPEILDDALWQFFVERLYYVQGDFSDAARGSAKVLFSHRQETWRSRAHSRNEWQLDSGNR
jgi:glucose-6-phosphate 1-dehydrogenase